MKEIKFIILILIIFIFSANGQVQVNLYTTLNGLFDDGTLGVLPLNARVALINENGICKAVNPISYIGNIYVGWTNSVPTTFKNVTFIVKAPIALSDSLEVNVNSTVDFNIPKGGDDLVQIPLIKINTVSSVMKNVGSISGKSTVCRVINGKLENSGDININKVSIANGIFVTKPGSTTILSSLQFAGGSSYLQGKLLFASSDLTDRLLFSAGSNIEFNDASVDCTLENIQIQGSSNLMVSGKTIFNSNRNDKTIGSMEVNDQSSVTIDKKSVMDLLNTTLVLNDAIKFNISSSSSLQTNSIIRILSNVLVKLDKESTLVSSAALLVNDDSQISIESSSTIESKILFLSEQSKLNVDYSTLTVGKSSNDRGGSTGDGSDEGIIPDGNGGVKRVFFGLQHTSTLTLTNSSSLNIAGPFGILNSTIVSVDSSSVNISKSFYQFDKSSVSSVNSTFDISNSFNVNDLSSFSFIDSTVEVSGSFIINSDKLNVQREFKSSIVSVDGKFLNVGGSLLFNKTNFQVNKNFTSIGIVNSIESNINVIKGQFNVGGKYIGENDKINLENGQMTIASKSNFECTGCTINSVGEIVQAKSSKLKLSDSTINNSGTGIIEISGDIILDKTSKLTNSGTGKFKLQANINDDGLGLDGAKVDNKGTFEILDNGNGNNTEINVEFDNSGTLSVIQNSNFKKLKQQNGLLNLVNNAEIYSKSSIDLTGGNIVGKGTINATVNLSENSILGHNTNVTSIMIVGNYTQSINTTVIITIDSMDDFSTISIMGEQININGGTLIIRMNSDMVKDSKNYNKSMSFMGSVSKSNSGNNNNNLEAASGSSSTSTGRGAEMTGDFTKIQFKTYTPGIDGDEEVVDECKYQMQKSSTSLSLLLGSSCEQESALSNGLTTPQIIGIAFAAFGAVVIASLVTTYIVFTKNRYSPRTIKLKQWVTKKF